MLLRNFPDCSARTLEQAEKSVDANSKGSLFRLLGEEQRFLFEVNVAKLGDITLISSGCDVACQLKWEPAGFIRHIFQVRGKSDLVYGKQVLSNQPGERGALVPEGTPLCIGSGAMYESFSIRISPDALRRKLSALLGEDADIPKFDYSASSDDVGMRRLRMAAFELARETDEIGASLSAPALAELAQATIVRFLLYQKHNYSRQLARPVALPSRRQLERIEDYIFAHWNEPLEIETLASESNIGARTIFRLFAKHRGITPSAFVRTMRLNQAKLLLLSGDDDASVLDIAIRCGFHSFGHFAREYRQAFGERPLDTLKKKPGSVSYGLRGGSRRT